jgi:hypothetical protein
MNQMFRSQMFRSLAFRSLAFAAIAAVAISGSTGGAQAQDARPQVESLCVTYPGICSAKPLPRPAAHVIPGTPKKSDLLVNPDRPTPPPRRS